MNILVCDDDREIVKAIEIYLKNEGYTVYKAYDGREAVDVLNDKNIQLAIIDIMMPRMDGMNATNEIRKNHNIPIIMLSAKTEDMDKIMGLNMGADDYMTKPFNPLELIARVKSHLRRFTYLGGTEEIKDKKEFATGGLLMNDEEKRVFIDDNEVRLTPIEYKILLFLLINAGNVFSIRQIYEKVWNEPAYNPENTVAVHIRRIREKIEIDTKNPKYLKVVWGIGYKIEKIPVW